METIFSVLYDVLGIAVFIGAIIYVYFWPEKRCPKCETTLERVKDPGTNTTKEGCPTCGEYHRL